MCEFIEFLKELAEESGSIIRKYFRSKINIEYKSDTTPVTAADREAEIKLREMIMEKFPDHGILGEEFENINPDAVYQWILDPIDGTKNFVTGTCLFGSLIALLKSGKPILGMINNPILNHVLIGDGETTRLNGIPVRVRACKKLENATLLTTSHWSVVRTQDGEAFESLSRKVKMYRTWGDCYGYYLLATGYADIMIDPLMHIWDVASLVPIIEGAGGVITDYYGGDPIKGVGVIASSGKIHDEIIRYLNPKRYEQADE